MKTAQCETTHLGPFFAMKSTALVPLLRAGYAPPKRLKWQIAKCTSMLYEMPRAERILSIDSDSSSPVLRLGGGGQNQCCFLSKLRTKPSIVKQRAAWINTGLNLLTCP
jgi:hypothetical protein